MDWFTSDLHLSHKRMLDFRTSFKTIEEMDETIYNMFDVVHPGDRVFLLGDLSFSREPIEKLMHLLIDEKRTIVYWIEGNHDHDVFREIIHKDLHKCQTKYIKGYGDYKPIFMSHYPGMLWERSNHGAYMLHGHVHRDTYDKQAISNFEVGKIMNVNLEFHDYKLLSRDDVEEYMRSKPINYTEILSHGTPEQIKIVNDAFEEIRKITEKMYKKI